MSLANLYAQFARLLPSPALQVGDVIAINGGVATLALPGGGQAQARGDATIGQRVFFRDNAIEGPAPSLPFVAITV